MNKIAQGSTTVTPFPGGGSVGTQVPTNQIRPLSQLFDQNSSLADFFQALFYTAIAVGATLAVLRLGYAGFLYMGGDSFGKISEAKRIMQDVVVGLLLLLAVYVILNQINPDILNLDVLRSVQSSQQAPATNTFTQ